MNRVLVVGATAGLVYLSEAVLPERPPRLASVPEKQAPRVEAGALVADAGRACAEACVTGAEVVTIRASEVLCRCRVSPMLEVQPASPTDSRARAVEARVGAHSQSTRACAAGAGVKENARAGLPEADR